jgi:serine protease Do
MARAIATAALTLVVTGAALARGPETDPVRRSLVVEAVEKTSPAVVNVSTEQVIEQRGAPFRTPQDPFFDEFFHDFFDSRPRRYTAASLGSGVIVAEDGTILTNEHVVLKASKIKVALADGRDFDARLVGADADSDLAVLRIKTGDALPHVALGISSDLMIGETVIAIGNPFGLSHTVTTGVVSAVGRSLRSEDHTYTDFIQTDASINPGNSGGPLLNIRGALVGINTAIYGKAQGIGFAIPVDRARRVMADLVSYGEVRRSWIGVSVQDLTPNLARHFGTAKGVLVADVDAKGPANGRVARGDVVTRVDGHELQSREEFEDLVAAHGVGDEVRLSVRRDEKDAEVALAAAAFPTEEIDDLTWQLIGVGLGEDDEGLLIAKVRDRSPAARIGVRRNDRVLGVGGAAVSSRAEFRRRMIELRQKRSVLLTIGRGPYQYNVDVPMARE